MVWLAVIKSTELLFFRTEHISKAMVPGIKIFFPQTFKTSLDLLLCFNRISKREKFTTLLFIYPCCRSLNRLIGKNRHLVTLTASFASQRKEYAKARATFLFRVSLSSEI